jgi:hypothetical protein
MSPSGSRRDLVVAHVAQADEDQRPGEVARPIRKARAELAEHRDEGLVLQRVDLVEEEHQRPRRRLGPGLERGADAAAGLGGGPRRRLEIGRQARAGATAPRAEDRALGGARIGRERSARLHREQRRHVRPLARQLAAEREQRRRLADLPGSAED